jgi:hypothetical protein
MASDNRRLLTNLTKEEHIDLFKGGLKMLLNFTTTAIDILNDNMKGTIGLYYGLEAWGRFLQYYLGMFEKTLVIYKKQINTQGYIIAERLSLPLMKDIGILIDMCKEGRTPITLHKLQVYRHHIQYLLSKPNPEWTEDLMKIHIFSINSIEFEKIKEKVNDPVLVNKLGVVTNQALVLNPSQLGQSQNSALDLSLPKQ